MQDGADVSAVCGWWGETRGLTAVSAMARPCAWHRWVGPLIRWRTCWRSAACSHDHPKGIEIAQATALAVFLARKGQDKEEIRDALEERFGWDLSLTLPEIREQALHDGFDETWKSVPPAIGVFLNTEDFTDCLRQTIALGCDADTQACISCAVAEAYYGPDEALLPRVLAHLDKPLARILESFCGKFGV